MRLLTFFVCMMMVPALVMAQEVETELTDQEQALIEKALGEDTALAAPVPGPKPLIIPSEPIRLQGGRVSTPSMMNPAIALIVDFALASFSSDEPLQTGAHDPTKSGFNLQQFEFHAESKIDQHFDLQVNLLFSEFGVEIEEIYAQTLSLPFSLKARVGQFLLPFGRINPTHPHSWHFVDQALVIGTFFGGEGGRGMGAEISWLAPLPWFAELTLAMNQKAGECCSKSYPTGLSDTIDGLEDFLYTGRLVQFFDLTDSFDMLLGGSYVVGQNGTGPNNQTHLRGGDLLLKYKSPRSANRTYTSLQLEWTQRVSQVPGDTIEAHGGYLQWLLGLTPKWEVGARYEWVDGTEQDPFALAPDATRRRYSGQVTWYPSHFSRIRLQGSQDTPSWREDPIVAWMLAFEVLAGAHGAHKY